ncbi:MAG: minor capsid protein 2 [Bacteriophage sp.]|nr:MAG: minor capsid protein 2 [Bacteriophage sp.]UWG95095.1 MAG: minor capsid protein 2 [Bacteriophage sp.]UWI02462.1 MAG: minor capsid protein 2 [Bacteriophage sp.]
MAKRQKITRFSIQSYDAAHYRQTEQYTQVVNALFDRATTEIAKAVAKGTYDPDKPFSFDDYPGVKSVMQGVTKQLADRMITVIETGSKKQWLFACDKNDGFIASIMDTSKLSKARLKKMQDRNLEALQTFQKRKVEGMNLSQRVWKYVGQYKAQLESALDVGLGEGRNAAQLSRDVRENLKEPNRLFRRVRDKRGNLVLSKAAKAFHPGQGVYRSSYKNAMRLTRSEINMAYRESDFLRWQSLDFVVGFEIRRSNHEPLFKCDICEKLVGRYPKTFKFKGWHPQCMCYAVPILMDEETFDENELGDLKAALHGTQYKKLEAKNLVTDVPDGFKQWVKDHEEAQKKWASTPYFIKDNFKDGQLSKGLKLDIVSPKPKIDPIQRQLDQLKPQISSIRAMCNEWGLNTFILDDAIQNRNPSGVVNAISVLHSRVDAVMQEYKNYIADATEAIKEARKHNIDVSEILNDIAAITGDKRDWIIGKEVFKKRLQDLLGKIATNQASNDDVLKIKAPDWQFKPDKTKATNAERLSTLMDNLEHFYGKESRFQGYIDSAREKIKNGESDRWLGYELKSWSSHKSLMNGQAKPCFKSIDHLQELKGVSSTKIPIQWRKAYNEAIKAINEHDFVNKGYEKVYVQIEKAYNIYKLASLKEVKQIGFDNISPNMPYNIFTDYVKKIPGMMEALPSKEFFDSLKDFVPLVALKNGAHYSPTYKYVNISFENDNLQRMSKSPWYRKGLFYHEFGHAFDHQIALKSKSELMKIYDDWKKVINAGEGERLKGVIQEKLDKFGADFDKFRDNAWKQYQELKQIGKMDEAERLKKELFAKCEEQEALQMEFEEQLGAFTDCLQAAISGHKFIRPRGHDVKYWTQDKQLAEFIAHCSENYWGGNPIFKEIAPQLYDDMRRIIEKYMAKP